MKNTIFNIHIDFNKSKGGLLYDKRTNKKYLDFFGQYSTLTLGYNSDIFKKKSIQKNLLKIFPQKIVNCELDSEILRDFKKNFKKFLGLGIYKSFHFCSTGALAVEAAIKTSIYYSKYKSKNIIVLKGNFHGINGYGGVFTDRFDSVYPRLQYFPGAYIDHIDVTNAVKQPAKFEKSKYQEIITFLKKKIKEDKSSAVLVEPIQSTFGDRYLDENFLKDIQNICNKKNIPLIFDEIQTGFYTSGKKWYFQQIGVSPDIVIFGKKSQVSGIMVKKKFSEIFNDEFLLNVTWNSDLIDMYRSNLIINYLERNNLTRQIKKYSKDISNYLRKFKILKNVRSSGYLIAFDLDSPKFRDLLVKKLFENGMLVNPTRFNTVRLRPRLNTSLKEISLFKKIFSKSMNEIKS